MNTVKSGFTMVELLVSLGIILALSVSIIPVGKNYFDMGRYSAAKAGAANIATALSQYKFEMGTFPAKIEDLLIEDEQYGPYLTEDALKDPWNNDYNYYQDGNKFAVWSNGADKKNNSGGGVPTAFQGDDIGVLGH